MSFVLSDFLKKLTTPSATRATATGGAGARGAGATLERYAGASYAVFASL